jgi:hypothetical protein
MFLVHSMLMATTFPPVIDQWWIIILKQLFELFESIESCIGLPPAPPEVEFEESSKKVMKQQTMPFY